MLETLCGMSTSHVRMHRGSFSNISLEVLSLHAVLKEVEETLSDGGDGSLLDVQSTLLSTLKDGCENILKDVQNLINKYESLGTKVNERGFGWDGAYRILRN